MDRGVDILWVKIQKMAYRTPFTWYVDPLSMGFSPPVDVNKYIENKHRTRSSTNINMFHGYISWVSCSMFVFFVFIYVYWSLTWLYQLRFLFYVCFLCIYLRLLVLNMFILVEDLVLCLFSMYLFTSTGGENPIDKGSTYHVKGVRYAIFCITRTSTDITMLRTSRRK
jgi:hypothetical protein